MQKILMTAMLSGLIASAVCSNANAAGNSTAAPATTVQSNGGLSTAAGSIAAGANSAVNLSGNQLINSSPSGSTLSATTGAGVGGSRRR
jgi:hypothetical protein